MSTGSHAEDQAASEFPTLQPKGLWVLFITEMWERFSYYGMRALLVLYLIASTQSTLESGAPNTNPGFGWTEDSAYLLYGIYTWAVYLTPILGGWLADRFLGTHRSMLIGGWIIAAGHIVLALTERFGITAGKAVTLQTGPGALICFLTGLGLIIIGTGFFKPCVSVMVGQLYGENDPRRDSGFTIFYMGINLGAFFSPLVAGTLGEMVGWHWGFGSAAVGMVLGLIFYQLFRPAYLGKIGMPPHHSPAHAEGVEPTPEEIEEAIRDEHEATRPLSYVDFQRLAVILVLAFLGNIFFWTAFEQAGSSMNVFAKNNTARPFWLPDSVREFLSDPNAGPAPLLVGLVGFGLMLPLAVRFLSPGKKSHLSGFIACPLAVFGLAMVVSAALKPFGFTTALGEMTEFPASWYQSVNPLAIIIFAPMFSILWITLDKMGLNPSTPMKFCWGLWLLGLAFIAMIFGAMRAEGGELAGPQWLLVTYVVYTWGELCLSPVGLSMVTKLAPIRLQSLMMGVWFFTMSLSNLFAGLVARISTRVESGEWTFFIPGLPGFFLMLVVFPIGAGMILILLTPMLKRMMHGIK